MNCTRVIWRKGRIHPNLQNRPSANIACVARNWIDSVPESAATTFAFSSVHVFILLLWSRASPQGVLSGGRSHCEYCKNKVIDHLWFSLFVYCIVNGTVFVCLLCNSQLVNYTCRRWICTHISIVYASMLYNVHICMSQCSHCCG